VRIADVRRSHVRTWIADLSERLGAETVRTAHRVLARILDDAVADRMLSSNPAAGVKLPCRPPPRHIYLTPEQPAALADEAGEYGSLVLVLGVGGLRWGEAAALRVGDIDWLHRRISLHRNAVAVRGQMILGSLKSNKSRTVVLPSFVIEELAKTAVGKDRDDLLWPSSSGDYQHPPRVRSWLSAAVARCQKPTPASPELRHTICGTPQPVWRSMPGRTSKSSGECWAMPARR
jgi:integrase